MEDFFSYIPLVIVLTGISYGLYSLFILAGQENKYVWVHGGWLGVFFGYKYLETHWYNVLFVPISVDPFPSYIPLPVFVDEVVVESWFLCDSFLFFFMVVW
jgi:hypothetical protein